MRLFVIIGLEAVKNTVVWGTFGKGGVEHCGGTCPLHPLVYKRLVDCDTEHLQAILRISIRLEDTYYPEIVRSILADRGAL